MLRLWAKEVEDKVEDKEGDKLCDDNTMVQGVKQGDDRMYVVRCERYINADDEIGVFSFGPFALALAAEECVINLSQQNDVQSAVIELVGNYAKAGTIASEPQAKKED